MGGCVSRSAPLSKEDIARQREIEKQLRQDKKKLEHEVKLLLLGAGESGKSTLAKQMKIIYLSGFDDAERKAFRDVVHSNVFMWLRTLILAAEKLGLELEPANKEKAKEFTITAPISQQELTPATAQSVRSIWEDKAIQTVYSRANEFQLGDSTAYFFNEIDRISKPDYVPLESDVLRSRAKTTGITETEFDVDNAHFRMVDVGGQRSERKKWIHCFQDVTAVIFFVAMSEYNLTLYEDETVNRMHESLKLFDEICNSRWFSRTSIILFLNKCDIFREKIKTFDLKITFPDYDGGSDYEAACEFIRDKFMSLNQKEKHVYPHVTCATDTDNIRFVFSAVKDIILHQALEASGF